MVFNNEKLKLRRKITLLLFCILLLTALAFTNKSVSSTQISVFSLPFLTFQRNDGMSLQSEFEQGTDILCPKGDLPDGSTKDNNESSDIHRRSHRIRKAVKSKVSSIKGNE